MKIFKGNELILKFMLINISTGIAMGMVNLILPIYALSLNASTTQIGLIKGIAGIGDLLVVLPAGFLVDYLGSRKMLVLGISSGLITLITFTQVGNIEGEKGQIAGIFSFGFAMGSILGPTLGGMIGDIFGIQVIFLSFIPLFVVMALYTFMDDRKNGTVPENIASVIHDLH